MVPILAVPFIRKAKSFLEAPANFLHLTDTLRGSGVPQSVEERLAIGVPTSNVYSR